MRSGLSERVSLSSPFCYFYKKLRFNLRLQVETQLFIEKRRLKSISFIRLLIFYCISRLLFDVYLKKFLDLYL